VQFRSVSLTLEPILENGLRKGKPDGIGVRFSDKRKFMSITGQPFGVLCWSRPKSNRRSPPR